MSIDLGLLKAKTTAFFQAAHFEEVVRIFLIISTFRLMGNVVGS
jgi:hypothetical protein